MTANAINPHKLLQSKWTAVNPVNKEKHFIVTRVFCDEHDHPQRCILEAVLTGRKQELHWRELKDSERWLFGWH